MVLAGDRAGYPSDRRREAAVAGPWRVQIDRDGRGTGESSTLVVPVDNSVKVEQLPGAEVVEWTPYGGTLRPVTIETTARSYLSGLSILPRPLDGDTQVTGESVASGGVLWSWADSLHRRDFVGWGGKTIQSAYGPYGAVTVDRRPKKARAMPARLSGDAAGPAVPY